MTDYGLECARIFKLSFGVESSIIYLLLIHIVLVLICGSFIENLILIPTTKFFTKRLGHLAVLARA